MKEPEILNQIGGYLLDFKEVDTTIKVGRLDVHKDGRVTGELTISNGSKTILMPPSSFNFSSDRTRGMAAKQLGEKYPDSKANWVEVFDYLGYKVQELARQGESVIEVWAADDAPTPEFLVEPIIYKDQSNVIYGEKGVSKSTLAYAMGMIMALPWHDNPLELTVPDKPIVTLVLDWETNEATFRYYLSRLKRGMNSPEVMLHYRKCNMPITEELEAIEQAIKDTKADVLLIDSLAAAAGGEKGDLNGTQGALAINNALRKLNRTSLIIAQTSKSLDGKKTIYGNTMFTYYARNIFELCRNEDSDGDCVHLALFHRECNLGKKHRPIGFCMEYDDANKSLSIKRESVSVSEFIDKVTSQSAVYDALKKGPLFIKDIANATGLKDNSIRTTLSRMKDKGQVVKIEMEGKVGDKWALRSQYDQKDMPFS